MSQGRTVEDLALQGRSEHEVEAREVACNESRRRVSSLFVLAHHLINARALDERRASLGIGLSGLALYVGVVDRLDRAVSTRENLACDAGPEKRFRKAIVRYFRADGVRTLKEYEPGTAEVQRVLDAMAHDAAANKADPEVPTIPEPQD